MMVINLLLFILFCMIVANFGVYSLLLKIIARFKNVDHKIDQAYRPTVSLLIAAYNEGEFLEQKLTNTLELDYPKDLFNIVLVSDGSTDNTNEVARQFESRGVTVIINSPNQGKATALNVGMGHINSDIVVLSDANVIYQRSAIRKLVRNFADPDIGAVSGKVVLLNDGLSYSDAENTYYSVEYKLQQLESSTGNLIGADGAMYAIRRELFRPLPEDTLLDDLVLSMGVVQQERRLIYDPHALGFEQNNSELDLEYNRKVRIVAGGIQSLKRKTVWPPNPYGLTALKFTCHKVMRWIIGPVIILFLALSVLLGMLTGNYLLAIVATGAALSCPIMRVLARVFPTLENKRMIKFCSYITVMLKASVVGCYKAFSSKDVDWR